MKVRQNLYIDREIADALGALATGPGGNKSRLVNDALKDWLARRGTREIDAILKTRLTRIARALEKIQRDDDIIRESVFLLARYQLTVTAPLAEDDRAGRAVGRQRFDSFLAEIGDRLAGGRRTLAYPDSEGEPT